MVKTAMTWMSRGNNSEVSLKPSHSTSTIVSIATNHSSLQITTHKPNNKNSLQWSRAAQMVIHRRRKIRYLHITIKKLNETDPTFHAWDASKSIVMVWLVNSMEENISENYMCYLTTKELWML